MPLTTANGISYLGQSYQISLTLRSFRPLRPLPRPLAEEAGCFVFLEDSRLEFASAKILIVAIIG